MNRRQQDNNIYLVLTILALFTFGCASSSWDKAVTRANESEKLLVVEFYADWCGPCKIFEKNVLAKKDVQSELNNVEFHRYDFSSTAGRHHAKRLGITGVPSIVAVDKKGKPFRLLRGAVPKPKFIEFIRWAQNQIYPSSG